MDKQNYSSQQALIDLIDTATIDLDRLDVLIDYIDYLNQDMADVAQLSGNGVLAGKTSNLDKALELIKTQLHEFDDYLTEASKKQALANDAKGEETNE